jgi:hypothetical protein
MTSEQAFSALHLDGHRAMQSELEQLQKIWSERTDAILNEANTKESDNKEKKVCVEIATRISEGICDRLESSNQAVPELLGLSKWLAAETFADRETRDSFLTALEAQ